MLSEVALKDALAQAGLDAPVRFDEVTGSTQQTAMTLASEGAPEWTLVAAGHQTAGRGRLGRPWVDEPGASLMFSLVLRPAVPADRGGLITLLAGASIATAVREVTGRRVACKWPNDLLLGSGKLGGVLAESRIAGDLIDHVVLGVGVNLREPPEVDGAIALGDEVDETDLLAEFLLDMHERYRPQHERFAAAVLDAYVPLCATLGCAVRATTLDGTVVEGRASKIDHDGALVVETPGGIELVRTGEVEHLR